MINRPFEYFAPKTVREAVSLLRRHGSTAKLIAGGQSLVPLMNLGLAAPQQVVDLSQIKRGTLAYIRKDGKKSLAIGSMTTHHELENSALVRTHCPILQEAASAIADVQVRNRGTVGGSLCHADPAGDYIAPLLALDAEFHTINSRGKARTIGSDRFFVDVFTTSLRRDELLTEIRVPKQAPSNVGSAYLKLKLVEGGFAIVGAAALVSINRHGNCEHATVVLSGVGAKPLRVEGLEEVMRGKRVDENAIKEAGRLAFEAVRDPLSDLHAPADYRREMANVFTKRALKLAVARSRMQEA